MILSPPELVYQTRSGANGNCFEACLASLLHLPIIAVPEVSSWEELRDWLAERFNMSLSFYAGDEIPLRNQAGYPRGYSIVALRLPADGAIHSVVAFGNTIFHDPSPRRIATDDCPVLLWTILGE